MWKWDAQEFFDKLIQRIVVQFVLSLLRDYPIVPTVVAAMYGMWDYLTGVDWWTLGRILMYLVSLIPWVRKKWIYLSSHRLKNQTAKDAPVIIPRYEEDDHGYEGLYLTNEGSGAALDVIVEPMKIGGQHVRFTGPEVPYLKSGAECFFSLGNTSPTILLRGWTGTSIFLGILRKYQRELGDNWGAVVEGRIVYKDIQGVEHGTRFTIGADVLAKKGVTVRILTD